jgi:hypothetical protein
LITFPVYESPTPGSVATRYATTPRGFISPVAPSLISAPASVLNGIARKSLQRPEAVNREARSEAGFIHQMLRPRRCNATALEER